MIEADTKDWTWVLERPCGQCGFEAADVERGDLGRRLRDDAVGWAAVLAHPESRARPEPATWSPLEYACHVRDVHRVFAGRLDLMLAEVAPTFADWDQDETAIAERYDLHDPAAVALELASAAAVVAGRYDELVSAAEETWSRGGLRSNGSVFTIDSIARYHLHDVVHHAHDVRAVAARATIAAYEADRVPYSDASWALSAEVSADLDAFAAAVGIAAPAGAEVLEIGSAGGRDAFELERRGLVVRRSDIAPAFVDLMRNRGQAAAVLDPLTDDLLAGRTAPYDGVWASACLLHVARVDLAMVLRRLAEATSVGGVLGMSLKEGDGEQWSTHGQIRAPRRFTFWREEPLRAVLRRAGWRVDQIERRVNDNGQAWLVVLAVRG